MVPEKNADRISPESAAAEETGEADTGDPTSEEEDAEEAVIPERNRKRSRRERKNPLAAGEAWSLGDVSIIELLTTSNGELTIEAIATEFEIFFFFWH